MGNAKRRFGVRKVHVSTSEVKRATHVRWRIDAMSRHG